MRTSLHDMISCTAFRTSFRHRLRTVFFGKARSEINIQIPDASHSKQMKRKSVNLPCCVLAWDSLGASLLMKALL